MAGGDTTRLAVLIDADNESASLAKELLEEVAKYGTATIKRVYGDWTTPNLAGWRDLLHRFAIQPIQQFRYTKGKNSTDSALIIDAMDLLYAGNVDGFCIVSSDSDFTRLATRLREAGKVVYGLGRRHTPEAFIAACNRFIFLEVLKTPAPSEAPVAVADLPDLKALLLTAVAATARESGWSPLSTVGSQVAKIHSSFDARNYGFAKLSELVRKQSYLEVRETQDGSSLLHIHVRPK
jgi:uncharacterized LabA/DUF88 family protein